MAISANEIRVMARGEVNTVLTDWGDNASGQETGVLKSGDRVASCTVAVDAKPTGADDPTLGSVTAPDSSEYINGRLCSSGEWTQFNITMASNQAVGTYRLKLTATTTNSKTIPRFIYINVQKPR